MRVDFYHLTTTPIERALPQIAEKALAAGQRMAVVAEDATLLTRLDDALWTYRADSFLPHGRNGDQPVLLCAPGGEGGYPLVALADGVWRSDALSHDRALLFFDETAIDGARSAWRELKDAEGVERHYWKQDEAGRWKDMA